MGDIYDSTNYTPRKSIGSLLGRIKVAMMAALDEELAADRRLAPLELSAAQFSVIASLAGEERKSASDLCRGISYDAGAMTRMIDRLEAILDENSVSVVSVRRWRGPRPPGRCPACGSAGSRAAAPPLW